MEDPQRKSGAGGAPAAPAAPRHPIEDVPPLHRVFALAAIFIVGIAFWMVFWQNGSTLALWAKNNTDWTLFTDRPVAGMIQAAINPAFIILFGIPVASLWKRLDRRGLEPSTPMKMCLGLVCASAASAVLWAAALAGATRGASPASGSSGRTPSSRSATVPFGDGPFVGIEGGTPTIPGAR